MCTVLLLVGYRMRMVFSLADRKTQQLVSDTFLGGCDSLTSLSALCLPFYTQSRNFHLPINIGSWVHFLRPAVAVLFPVCCNSDFYDSIRSFTCEFCEITGKVKILILRTKQERDHNF